MEMLIMPGHYGNTQAAKMTSAKRRAMSKKPTGQLKLNMKKMPPQVQKRLMQAMRKKK